MPRVLLLEDHPRLAALVKQALQAAGIECDTVGRLDLARLAMREQPYSAVLIDRGLPDGDGLDLVRRLREDGNPVPCLVMTARDALHDRVDGLESGADDYLSKPFSMEELVARVRALLRRPPVQVSLSPTFGDVQIFPERSLMCCGIERISLASTELQIILTLFKANSRPVRRAALEAAAWGLQEAVTPNALDVALHRLRKKLDAIGSSVQINNVRTVGYAVEI